MSRAAVALAVVIAALVSLACSSGGGGADGSPQGDGVARTASSGEIDVKAAWLWGDGFLEDDLAAYPRGEFLFLELKLDAHSGDLASIDLAGSARLYTGGGQLRPAAWVAREDGSHHRAGVLVFPRPDVPGAVTLSLELGDGAVELAWDGLPEG